MNATFVDVVEDVKQLSIEEKQELKGLIDSYLIEERREEIYQNYEQSKVNLADSKLQFMNNKEMQDEYDFTDKKGVRGKYHKGYKEGHSVRIFDGEKFISDEYFAAIEPDVLEFFPDSKAINKALRSLIKLSPSKT